jgi:hypothetical protein
METSLIKRIKVVDDNPGVRDDYSIAISLAERTPVPETGPLGTLDEYIARETGADAAITDYQLRPSNYAYFDGIELAARWYGLRMPTILCTTFHESNVVQFRKYRRWVPVVMPPKDLNPDTLIEAIELVANELQGHWVAPRRPWRAQIHFVEVDAGSNTAIAKVPAWSEEAVAFRLTDLPGMLQQSLHRTPEMRFHAKANLGTENGRDLYVTDWEV